MDALDSATNDTTSSFMACEAPLLVSAVRNLANKRFAYVALCAAALALVVCIFSVFRIVRLAWNHYRAFMAKNGPILATVCVLHFVSLLIIIPLLLSTIVPSSSWCSSHTASRKVKVLTYILQSLSQCSTQCWLLACVACYAPSRQRRLPFRLSALRYYGPLAVFLASLICNAWTPFAVGNAQTGCEAMKHVGAFTAVEFAWSYALPLALLLAMSAAILRKQLNLASSRDQKLKQRSPTGFLNQANLIGLPMLSRFRPASRRSSMPSVMQNLRRSMRRSVKRATKKVRDTNKSQKALEFTSGSTKNLLEHLIPSASNSRRSSARSSFSIVVPVRPQHTAFWRVIAVTAVHLLLKTPFAIWQLQATMSKM
ncbi:hypothetical protein AAVH_17423 [Aphelenchoides avenae]|nr:hypothetical protein AAVH_17423 [Aphelenchus avenae]